MSKRLIIWIFTILTITQASAQVNTDRVINIGRNALFFKDYVLAIQYFNQVIKAKPHLAEPYYLRAIAKISLDDVKGAEEDCTACLERNPFITNAYHLRGDSRLKLKDYAGANEDYKRVLTEMPNNKFLLINLGIANIETQSWDEAEKYLQQLTTSYPSYPEAYLTQAAMHLARKDTATAFASYDKAIELDKYSAHNYAVRGSLHLQQRNFDQANADLSEAIKLAPEETWAYLNRGTIRYHKKDLRGAMNDYDKVLELEPQNIIARYNRALLRAQVGDDNRAIEDFNKVIETEPDNYMAYYNRAILKNAIADYRGAISDLNVVMAEYPDYYQGFYYRSELKRRLGDMKGAEKDYNYARAMEHERQRQLATAQGRNAAIKQEQERQRLREATREKSNKEIDKFNLLMVADKSEEDKNKYSNDTRGRVQDRNVSVQLLPQFVVAYYDNAGDNSTKKFVYFSPLLVEMNKNSVFLRKLRLTNEEVALTEKQIETHFRRIEEYTQTIAQQPEKAVNYFARGMEYLTVQDFASAAHDLRKAIQLDKSLTLAYFNLAVIIGKELASRHGGAEYEAKASNVKSNAVDKNLSISQDLTDYANILANYDQAIAQQPQFAFAYYNRACVKAQIRDHKGAIADLDEVIKIDAELAEAYYNRGLCKLMIRDTESGLSDLRRAGELGITQAYSIIKRMTVR